MLARAGRGRSGDRGARRAGAEPRRARHAGRATTSAGVCRPATGSASCSRATARSASRARWSRRSSSTSPRSSTRSSPAAPSGSATSCYAWTWNLRRLGELRDARQAGARVPARQRQRRPPEHAPRQRPAEPAAARADRPGRGPPHRPGAQRPRGGRRDAVRQPARGRPPCGRRCSFVLVAGSRHLLTRGVPAVGQMVSFGDSSARPAAEPGRAAGAPPASARRRRTRRGLGLIGTLGFPVVRCHGAAAHRAHPRDAPARRAVRLPAAAAHRVAVGAARVPARLRRGPAALQRAGPRPVGRRRALRRRAAARRDARPGEPGGAVRARRRRGRARGARHPVAATACWPSASSPRSAATVAPVAVVAARAHGRRPRPRWRDRGEPAGRPADAGRVGRSGAVVAVVLHLPWTLDFLLPGSTLESFTGGSNGAGAVRPGRAAPVRDRSARRRAVRVELPRGRRAPAAHRAGGAPHLGGAGLDRRRRVVRARVGWRSGARSTSRSHPSTCSSSRPPPAWRSPPPWAWRPSRSTCPATGSAGGRSHRAWPRWPSSSASCRCSAPSFDGRWSMPVGRPLPRPRLHRRRERRGGVPRAVDR